MPSLFDYGPGIKIYRSIAQVYGTPTEREKVLIPRSMIRAFLNSNPNQLEDRKPEIICGIDLGVAFTVAASVNGPNGGKFRNIRISRGDYLQPSYQYEQWASHYKPVSVSEEEK